MGIAIVANSRKIYRVAVPLGLAGLSLGAALLTPSLASAQNPSLPIVSRTSLLSSILSSKFHPFTATLVTTSSILGSAAASLGPITNNVTLPDGTATVNLWAGSGNRLRAQILDPQSERDVYLTNGSGWIWDSSAGVATHITAASPTHKATNLASPPGASSYSPQALAAAILRRVGPTTIVSMGKSMYIGGQAAYDLQLAPVDRNSLFRKINIYIDAKYSDVVGLGIIPRGSDTAVFSAKFSSISYGEPASTVFAFKPPAGTKVTNLSPTSVLPGWMSPAPPATRPSTSSMAQKFLSGAGPVKLYGKAWSTVLVSGPGVYSQALSAITKSSPSYANILSKALEPVSTPSGEGKLLQTPLLDILVLPNGEIIAGSVDRAELIADSTLLTNQ